MKEITLPTTDFAENAVVNVSRVFAVLWCIAQNIYRKGEQRTMKMIENEMNVTVPLEIIKASEIEPKEVKWLWYPYRFIVSNPLLDRCKTYIKHIGNSPLAFFSIQI